MKTKKVPLSETKKILFGKEYSKRYNSKIIWRYSLRNLYNIDNLKTFFIELSNALKKCKNIQLQDDDEQLELFGYGEESTEEYKIRMKEIDIKARAFLKEQNDRLKKEENKKKNPDYIKYINLQRKLKKQQIL